ncbi:ribonucleoside-diphosphate reductase, beta subunit [Plasmodium vivax North Korean]|uniref:Ribonucleoside-diphosphate reductase, beta subunit n=1 Tax=Plasmodium vivax North Korean TaxID=1035514 RepID=A0A0J9TMH8_PLAVI|nr:ribonucleoside-diphosphate reductase, beta subunit [Plasmodium vivax North Korean]
MGNNSRNFPRTISKGKQNKILICNLVTSFNSFYSSQPKLFYYSFNSASSTSISDYQNLLNLKINIITEYYNNIKDKKSLYMAMAASVFLESFLFYSGFFYPLYLSSQGMMVNSGEIINLIIRDESIHGLYIGHLASKLFSTFHLDQKTHLKKEVNSLLEKLMRLEEEYTKKIYNTIGITEQVNTFLRYNANKALQNLGLEDKYDVGEKDINPMIFNGLSTSTRNHDFFSTKGNGYIKTTQVEEIQDEDFIFT